MLCCFFSPCVYLPSVSLSCYAICMCVLHSAPLFLLFFFGFLHIILLCSLGVCLFTLFHCLIASAICICLCIFCFFVPCISSAFLILFYYVIFSLFSRCVYLFTLFHCFIVDAICVCLCIFCSFVPCIRFSHIILLYSVSFYSSSSSVSYMSSPSAYMTWAEHPCVPV